MTMHTVALRGGTLTLSVERADMPLEALCDFGTRRNPKRPYLFISKVLGRHIPVRPSTMLDTHERLAAKIGEVPGPVLTIGMAETATGLGQGVYEAYLRQSQRDDALFVPTTRYVLRQPLAFTFDESHSHATEHRVYWPEPELRSLFEQARTLILVDDEISTGRTLAELAAKYRGLNPHLQRVVLVSLLDWLSPERRTAIAERVGLRVEFHSLLRGQFSFAPTEFDAGPMPDVVGKGHCIDELVTGAQPRLGIQGVYSVGQAFQPDNLHVRLSSLTYNQAVIVLGTGEFVHPPFRLALDWERQGHNVWFQSTTRSPILCGEAINSLTECIDNYGDDIPNYVYNLVDKCYDRVFIGYETHIIPETHGLGSQLNATCICF